MKIRLLGVLILFFGLAVVNDSASARPSGELPVPSEVVVDPSVDSSTRFEIAADSREAAPTELVEKSSICGERAALGPIGGNWSRAYQGDCAFIGMKDSTGRGYRWYVQPYSSAQGCGMGQGFKSNGSTYWQALGCGRSGTGNVSWGKRMGMPFFKAKSMNIILGAPIYFE